MFAYYQYLLKGRQSAQRQGQPIPQQCLSAWQFNSIKGKQHQLSVQHHRRVKLPDLLNIRKDEVTEHKRT
jgi:hypothetical protein